MMQISAFRRVAGLTLCLPLMACFGPDGGGALGFLAAGTEREEVVERDTMRSVTLFDGEVVVRGPDGYCVDRKSLKTSGKTKFVLLASCEALSGVRGQKVDPAVMTLSVMATDATHTLPTVAEIAKANPSAEVLGKVEKKNLTLVHLSQGGDAVLQGGDPKHWRGATLLNGHLIALALYAREGTRKAGPDGRNLIAELSQNLHKATPKVVPKPVVSPASDTAVEPTRGAGSLLGGLFPGSG